jgi:hypothetical protein
MSSPEPFGLAFDGASIWTATTLHQTVRRIRLSNGAILGTFATGGGPTEAAFDGANIWMANQSSNTVSKP